MDHLPGLAPSEPGAATPVAVSAATRAGWWVSTGTKVVASGQRSGFRHQLMHQGQVIQAGTGADCRRTFQSQAAYFNERGVVPDPVQPRPPGRAAATIKPTTSPQLPGLPPSLSLTMTPIPTFTHHVVDLLPAPGPTSASRKSHSRVAELARKDAASINGPLKLVGRTEIALLHPADQFFSDDPRVGAAKSAALAFIEQENHLRWVLLTTRADSLNGALPSGWCASRCKNLCLGLVVSSTEDLEPQLASLRKQPVRWKLLLIHSPEGRLELAGKLGGIDWVIFSGTAEDEQHARAAHAACSEAGVAFLKLDPSCPDGVFAPLQDAAADGASVDSPLPEHPFGPAVDIRRMTLPGLKRQAQLELDLTPAIQGPAEAASLSVAPDLPAAEGAVPHCMPVASPLDDAGPVPPAGADDVAGSDAVLVLAAGNLEMPVDVAMTVPADDPVDEVRSVEVEVAREDPEDDAGQAAELAFCRLYAAAERSIGTHDSDLAEFTRLDNIVIAGRGAFLEVGSALLQIREKSLWRAGGHASWSAYCEEARGFTKQHLNRLIKAVTVVAAIQTVEPIGSTSVATRPQSEAQVRELTRLRDPASQVAAWTSAVKDARGQQPTAARLRDVVAAMMAEVDPVPTKKPKRTSKLDVAIADLRAEVEGNLDRDRLRGLLDVIEKLRSC